MDRPVKVAFCKLLYAANGGEFNKLGLPIKGKVRVRGRCDAAYDCVSCPLMMEWLALTQSQGWRSGWECLKCLSDTRDEDLAIGVRELPGFFSAGRSPDLSPEDEDFDPDRPILWGCTRCGWESSFLQLVLRKRT